MKKWYITPSTNIVIDTESDEATRINNQYTSINCCYVAPEDCTVNFTDSKGQKTFDVKKGQIILTFYKDQLPNQIVILDSKEFFENIDFMVKEDQKKKEEWAKRDAEACGNCDSCCGKPIC